MPVTMPMVVDDELRQLTLRQLFEVEKMFAARARAELALRRSSVRGSKRWAQYQINARYWINRGHAARNKERELMAEIMRRRRMAEA